MTMAESTVTLAASRDQSQWKDAGVQRRFGCDDAEPPAGGR
jgi:hypothetical protein